MCFFQDIHRREQDSAWICARAWWHWWMYPFRNLHFRHLCMLFVNYRTKKSHFTNCFMMLLNATIQLSVTGRLCEFECLRLWKRAVFHRVNIHCNCNIFFLSLNSIFPKCTLKWVAIALWFVCFRIFSIRWMFRALEVYLWTNSEMLLKSQVSLFSLTPFNCLR